MKEPVITSVGKIYDKEALEGFLRVNNHVDETGVTLGANDYQLFPAFREQVRAFQFYHSQNIPYSAEEKKGFHLL